MAATWAITEKNYSQRRACGLVGLDPKTYRYASKRPGDGEIRARLRVLAGERRRFGYRRLHILLARDGVRLNHKRLFRLYREEKLGMRKRGGRKRALGTRSPLALPEGSQSALVAGLRLRRAVERAPVPGAGGRGTTSAASALVSSPIRRCRACGSAANSMASSSGAAAVRG